MKLNDFFSQHPVFTLDELDRFLDARGTTNRLTRIALLAHHRKAGHIIPIRRGLYAVAARGVSPEVSPVDPFLIAGKVKADAILAYHTALEFHGRSYSSFNRFTYVSRKYIEPFSFRSYEFRCVQVPQPLRSKGKETSGVIKAERQGLEIRVTNLERTLVDVLDRPDLSGSWEEIWRSLESIEFFDLESVIEYTRLLGNATTASKVGFFLEQHKDTLLVDEKHLGPLCDLRPRGRHYLQGGKNKAGKLVSRWNLVVPREILDRSWEEMP